jgi:2',3'-cyclic-nucleotide 2'-phosphodiesterase / 3'-nucleotidase / 5'-nucleotidase
LTQGSNIDYIVAIHFNDKNCLKNYLRHRALPFLSEFLRLTSTPGVVQMHRLYLLVTLAVFVLTMVLRTAPSRAEGSSVTAQESPVRISQVYGAGGNQGALWQADFIELFNATASPILLDGWAVEYAPADSASWRRTPLDQALVEPYSYLLVEQAAGSSGAGEALPEPDIRGSINLNASAGKVRLVDNLGAVVDLLGYGNADQ